MLIRGAPSVMGAAPDGRPLFFWRNRRPGGHLHSERPPPADRRTGSSGNNRPTICTIAVASLSGGACRSRTNQKGRMPNDNHNPDIR